MRKEIEEIFQDDKNYKVITMKEDGLVFVLGKELDYKKVQSELLSLFSKKIDECKEGILRCMFDYNLDYKLRYRDLLAQDIINIIKQHTVGIK